MRDGPVHRHLHYDAAGRLLKACVMQENFATLGNIGSLKGALSAAA